MAGAFEDRAQALKQFFGSDLQTANSTPPSSPGLVTLHRLKHADMPHPARLLRAQ
jgi:hypothetical protein